MCMSLLLEKWVCLLVFFLITGWFPAKFVQLLDERSKEYSSAGDDSITETITDLVRGNLCLVMKQVLEHGMKRPNFLGRRKTVHLDLR